MEGKLIRPRGSTPEERAAHQEALAKDFSDAFVKAIGEMPIIKEGRMGTDIHLYVEVRRDGKWESADTWTPDEYSFNEMWVDWKNKFYNTPNYVLFGVLAGVRGREDPKPISEPKGLPDDMSEPLAKYAREHFEHTGSWLTLRELMEYDWTQNVTNQGYVALPAYVDWKVSGYRDSPTESCIAYFGGMRHDVTMEVADAIVESIKALPNWKDKQTAIEGVDKSGMVSAFWTRPLYRECSEFLAECLPRLWRLGSPDDVRIVFWFDS